MNLKMLLAAFLLLAGYNPAPPSPPMCFCRLCRFFRRAGFSEDEIVRRRANPLPITEFFHGPHVETPGP